MAEIQVVRAIYSGKNIIGCAPTGARKTLSFWITMFMAMYNKIKQKRVIVITPLNLLGRQTVESLLKVGIWVVLLMKETTTLAILWEVEAGKYNVMVTNPEMPVCNKAVQELFWKPAVAKTLFHFVLDEGHCVNQWANFQQHYRNLGDLHYTVPGDIPFYVASATLPQDILENICEMLNLHEETTEFILYLNDHPDIGLMVQPIVNPVSSYQDLNFLIPGQLH
ncbi:hypothetical protein D9756_004492 [Leucocoprinus leucothites]|uniref:DNA 3'-5' helicase n=1 Tax=Leucocoprinus leucothites TaxID=201217 RepID=A0A8H5GA64_9AGAR|nr:hypothetical protein D9756_004492 [Leucoagaricus leucothites]